MRQKVSRKRVIKFRNMQARMVGKRIRIFRVDRLGMSLQQYADKIGIEPTKLDRLEEGYELKVERDILLRILRTVGVCMRYNGLSDEQLINIFLYATKEDPPRLIG